MLERLTVERRVLRLDLLGHGESAKPLSGYEVSRQALAVFGVLERYGIETAHVVAHSAGGDIAVSILEQVPRRVRSVTFLGTAPHLGFVLIGASARLMRLPMIGPMLWRTATHAMFRNGLKKVFAPDFLAVPDVYVQSLRRLPHHAYAQGLAALEAYKNERDLCSRVARSDVPKLVIFGDRDTWVDPRAAEFWREKTDARVERNATLGHTQMAEAPESTAALVLDFLRNIDP
jgi:pimeloyl-ACP methyl ester carboxylesterase